MSDAYRANRKCTDEEIIRLNSVGLSLTTIAKKLDCHPTTITLRLKALKINPADTRRTFMEDVFNAMPKSQQDWTLDQLGPHTSVKDYVKNLMAKDYLAKNQPNQGTQHAYG